MFLFAICQINIAYSLSTSTDCTVQCEIRSLQRVPETDTQVYLIGMECTYYARQSVKAGYFSLTVDKHFCLRDAFVVPDHLCTNDKALSLLCMSMCIYIYT